jgi:D-3-phosphoglycerate dehydrogenase
LPLVEKLGRIVTALAAGIPATLEVEVLGEIADQEVAVLELSALKGLFTDLSDEPVSYVNAPLLAADKGVQVAMTASTDSPDFKNLVRVKGALADGSLVSVAGTLAGTRQREKIVEVNGFHVDVLLAEHIAFFTYVDRPGVVGYIGNVMGDSGINIAGMQVSRRGEGGDAMIVLTVDEAIAAADVASIVAGVGARTGCTVDLVD